MTIDEPEPGRLAGLLDAILELLRTYLVLTASQANALVLWIAHTHALDAFETTPFLAVTSPEKRCGKSRLLDVLELLVARPWRAIMPTEAVLFRKINTAAPTLLLDETDAIFNAKNANTEPLRAVLNAGNRRGTHVPRCVGPQQELRDFSVFCAKALTGIGALPDTVADRAIPIRMARKRPDETVQRFRRREAVELAEPIQQELASWAQDADAWLQLARPHVPQVLNDRAEEAWEPLLAIAELAGGTWPERARAAALHLSGGSEPDEEAWGVKLLADVRDVFQAASTDRLSSASLAGALCELEESPWGDLSGKPLDPRGLASRLRPFAVRPRTIRLHDNTTAKGYHLEQFLDAFARYLSADPDTVQNTAAAVLADFERHNGTTRMAAGFAADFTPPQEAAENERKPAWGNGCGDVADESAGNGARRVPRPGEPGYPLWIAKALAGGHITEREHDHLALWHRRWWREASAA